MPRTDFQNMLVTLGIDRVDNLADQILVVKKVLAKSLPGSHSGSLVLLLSHRNSSMNGCF